MKTTTDIAKKYQQFVMPTYSQNLALVKGKGTRVWDADGKVYLDFMSGIAVQNIGHCHPAVVAAIREQAAKLMHCSNLFYNDMQPKLAEALINTSMAGKCFFCNSGAEANEALIKLARLWGSDQGKYEVITMENSFHGRTLATLAATGQTKYQDGFEPVPEGFAYVPFNDFDALQKVVTPRTAAVLIEAVQGEGGVVPADIEYLQAVRKFCTEHSLLMLFDEVQCGMGRTGHWYAYQRADVEADAFSLAKSLGSGFPIGAIVAGRKLADVFQPGKHASTFGGNPLACAAALATIRTIEAEKLVEHAATTGEEFMAVLGEFVGKYEHVKSVRGVGLMIGL
ncbi:MAG: aspartate aminotransferase family protein, partial [bacterium]